MPTPTVAPSGAPEAPSTKFSKKGPTVAPTAKAQCMACMGGPALSLNSHSSSKFAPVSISPMAMPWRLTVAASARLLRARVMPTVPTLASAMASASRRCPGKKS